MATSIEQILGKDINSLKELREEIKRLQDSIANVDPATQEFTDTTQKLIAAQNQLTSVTRASKDANVAAEDSIVGMERQYKSLYNTYKMLTEEQRNSPFGTEMAAQLDGLSKKLNETKKGVGNFKDNIGHYSEGVIDAFGKMGISMGALQKPMTLIIDILQNGGAGIIEKLNGVSDTLKKLKTGTTNITQVNQTLNQTTQNISSVTNVTKAASGGIGGMAKALGGLVKAAGPIMIVVGAFMALKAIVDGVRQAIQNNEESQMALRQAMANFQPIIDGVKNAFDALGKVVVKFVGWIGDATTAVRKFFSSAEGKKAIEEQVELYKGLEKSQQTLIKQKREYQKLNAKDQAEVERLREEASELENGAEKRRLLNEAKAKQAEIDARNVEIAKEELRILTEQSKLTANDAAMNDKLAAAEAKVAQEEANAARNARTFNKALKTTATNANSAADAAKKLAEEAKKVYEETVENSKSEFTKLKEQYEKRKRLLERFGYDTTLLTKQFEEAKKKLFIETAQKASDEYGRILQSRSKLLKNYYSNLSAQATNESAASGFEIEFAKAQKKKFDELYNAYLSVPKGELDGWEDAAKEVVQTMNDVLGTDLEFPPKLDPESLKLFDENMKMLANVFNKNVTDAISKRIMAQYNHLLTVQKEFLTMDGIKALGGSEADYQKTLVELHRTDLEEQKAWLEKNKDNEQVGVETRIELQYKYYKVVEELRQADWEAEALHTQRKEELWNNAVDSYQQMGDAMISVLNSVVSIKEADIDAEQKEGKITEKEAAKKKKALLSYQKVMTAVEVASIAASTASGIMGVWKAYALEKIANAETAAATGPAAAATLAALNAKSLASAILQTAGMAVAGAAQITAAISGTIAKGKSLDAEVNTAGGASTVATPTTIASEPYSYSRTIQTQEDIDELQQRPVWVSVVDINDAQNKVKVVENESSF